MVKQTQTISRQQPTNCFSVFDHFVGLAFKGLISVLYGITPFSDEAPLQKYQNCLTSNSFKFVTSCVSSGE